MKIKERLLALLFPPRCAFCRRLCESGVCEKCDKTLPRADLPRRSFRFCEAAAPLHYTGDVRSAVLRLKFRGGYGAFKGFAALMAECAAEEYGGEFDCISFVPVSARRRRERGCDQAEMLAREMAKIWDTEEERLLKKVRHTKAQSSIHDAAARQANAFGVYEAVNADRIRGAKILLVDDIVTTGATFEECSRVLKEAGAKAVYCIALAAAVEKGGKGQK